MHALQKAENEVSMTQTERQDMREDYEAQIMQLRQQA